MVDLVSLLSAFLLGVASGAAGKYFADKYTDQRKDKEARKKIRKKFDSLRKVMPNLLDEMKTDLLGDKTGLVREFVLLPSSGVAFNGSKPRFHYYEDAHNDLRNKISLLLDDGYVVDVSTTGTPIFRMSEQFANLLRA